MEKNPEVIAPDEGTTGTYTTPLGILIPQEDSDALANSVMDIVTGRKTFDGDYIAKFTRENYDQQVINQKLLALFESVSTKSVDAPQQLKKTFSRPKGGFDYGDE